MFQGSLIGFAHAGRCVCLGQNSTHDASDALIRASCRRLVAIGFDRFMSLALYAPGLGYYSRAQSSADASGSDFVTAPEMSPLFGRALAAR